MNSICYATGLHFAFKFHVGMYDTNTVVGQGVLHVLESVSITQFICLADYGSSGSLFLFIDAVHCV